MKAPIAATRATAPAAPAPVNPAAPVADEADLLPADPVTAEEALPEPLPAPRRPGLIPTDIADALARVLTAATSSIRSHEAGSRAGGDIENVHQMRVATRRIRAYLKAAKPALDPDASGGIRDELKDLADALGQVRDLDVMIQRMHTEAAGLEEPDSTALEGLIGALDDERGTARSALIEVLDDPGHAALLADLDRAAFRPPVADPWADLEELASAEWGKLAKGRRKLHKTFGEHPPDDDLHDLRILGKRARYTAELLPRKKKVQRFLAALADFQEVLGDHQDACVLEDRLREMVAGTGSAAGGIAAGRVIERCRARRVQARADYPKAWAAVEKAAADAYPASK
ncbi:CHAD domain-containing protein [Nakamurella alba]|uniref:CHAD domain-containing protein n=1 Tax=Nakamurella alba TaxID=2665158 RepID=UPI0018AC4AEC|nr:CHAD domain-containing protein [Nakamurella alba]